MNEYGGARGDPPLIITHEPLNRFASNLEGNSAEAWEYFQLEWIKNHEVPRKASSLIFSLTHVKIK